MEDRAIREIVSDELEGREMVAALRSSFIFLGVMSAVALGLAVSVYQEQLRCRDHAKQEPAAGEPEIIETEKKK